MKKILVLFLAVLLVSVMSCENPFLKKMLVEEEKGGGIKLEGDFIEIIPPTTGIVGVDPDYTLPENDGNWKGVFRAGRKVKLSPYKLGKTEVTYELWHEVLTWAESNGYTFANKGLEGWDGTGGGGAYPNYANIGKLPTAKKNHPVIMISWRDCIVWCNAYTAKAMLLVLRY